jgi:cholesterol oxidase
MSNENGPAGKAGRPLTRLSSPISELTGHKSVIVVGSGYGGAITASRLARTGKKVWLLERGRELHPGEFPDSLPEALANGQLTHGGTSLGSRTGLFDLRTFDDMNVMVGCGLGGTSLINANVSLKAEPAVFQRERWPLELRMEGALNAGYTRAEAMLRPTPVPEVSLGLPKLDALRQGAQALPSAHVIVPPINVTFTDGPNAAGIEQHACTMCGDCVAGCNVGAKNTVLMNYLPDAVAHGAKIFTKVSVHHISRDGGRWKVHFHLLETGREAFDGDALAVTADVVVLAAGTLGSTEILLRSREIGLSAQIGTNFSGNGDVLAFSYNGDEAISGIGWGIHRDGRPLVGPCITGAISLEDGPLDEHMIIEEGALPSGLTALLPGAFAIDNAIDGVDTDPTLLDEVGELGRQVSTLLRGPYSGALNNTMTYLVMAHDDADGTLELVDDHVRIVYPDVASKPIFERIEANLQAAAAPLGGQYLPNPIGLEALGNNMITVHPLGGCPMGDDATTGVVNHKGQVFDGMGVASVHDGLYVADGSVVPTSLGVNPLLTISALAERNVELLAQDRGWQIDFHSATPPLPLRPTVIGIQFTETMAGSVAVGEDIPREYAAARDVGEAAGNAMSFLFTIIVDDLDAFIRNPFREATLIGTVDVPAGVSLERLTVRRGTFNLLVPNADRVGTVDMTYSAVLDGAEGRTYCLKGRKDIRDDRGFDTWSDTTTLYVDLYEGDDARGSVIARGILTISPEAFATQLRSMRVTGTHDIGAIVAAKAKFGRFFASELAHVFGGVATPARLIDTAKPPRIKRPLRAPTPVRHPFTTPDGVDLLLTRYRGGELGPVLVTHGLGVSSSIFTIDTIDTNLVEYLCANKYDVWLLDYRSSIDLPASRTEYTGDDIAEHDYPAAVDYVLRHVDKAKTVQVVAHCFGSTTFMCAMLAGLQDVRAAVCSQIATHIDAPTITRVKSRLRVPNLLGRIGIDTMTARAYDKERRREMLFDQALNFWPMSDERCDSATCHRITFLYSLLYEHQQLNPLTHDEGLPEMFGVTATSALDHLATMVRAGTVVGADKSDRYMPHLRRLALPLTIIHGERNACYLPSSTEKTVAALTEANGPDFYRRHLIPKHGHIDCIFGRTAAQDVYPLIVAGLQPTAERR